MDGQGFLTEILLNGDDGHVAGLDDINIPVTQETDFGTEVQQIDVQVQVQGTGGTKGAKRTRNFNYEEDEVICSGWLNASKDPINGVNQSRTTFWGRVHTFFEKNKKTEAIRRESSIMHRWLTIQAQVNKYCACYEAICRRNQSGQTIQDKISEATKMYQGLDKEAKKFTVLPCWNILKGEDKWKAKRIELAEMEKLAANKNKKKSTKQSRPREEEATNNDFTEEAAPEAEKRKRPEGVKKAKQALKRGGDACMEALDMMWAKKEAFDKEKEKAKQERFKESIEIDKAALELEKKRVEIEEKKAEAELMKEEKEIMTVDKTTLDPLQLEYYEMMQRKIIARRLAN